MRYIHPDHLGTTRAITDSVGNLVASFDFFPFGELAAQSGLTEEVLQYTGHERDANKSGSTNNLDYMHAQYYSPHLSRFLRVDPARSYQRESPQSWNRYSYVQNTPLRLIDPDGRFPAMPPLSPEARLRITAMAKVLSEKMDVKTEVSAPVISGKGAEKLLSRRRIGVKGLQFFELDLTDQLNGGSTVTVTAQTSGLGITGVFNIRDLTLIEVDKLSLLGTVFEKIIFGDQPDQLTTGVGAGIGIEFSQDASILEDFFLLLMLPLEDVVQEALGDSESTINFVPRASSDRNSTDD